MFSSRNGRWVGNVVLFGWFVLFCALASFLPGWVSALILLISAPFSLLFMMANQKVWENENERRETKRLNCGKPRSLLIVIRNRRGAKADRPPRHRQTARTGWRFVSPRVPLEKRADLASINCPAQTKDRHPTVWRWRGLLHCPRACDVTWRSGWVGSGP